MDALINWIADLSPTSLNDLETYYTDDATFQDPFNKVYGRNEIKRLFEDMFKLDDVKFEVLESIKDGEKGFLTWNMYFKIYGRSQMIHGGSYLHFAEDGRVKSHRDYWDAAEEVYEKFPVLGHVLRFLKKRFQ